MKTLIEKLKALRLYLVRCSYFIWNKYFRSDKVKTQNGRIYSRKEIKKQIRECCTNQNGNFGDLSHPQQNEKVCTHNVKSKNCYH
jgi:hypothetical protein